MVSTRPPTSKSSRPFNNPLVSVPKAPITIGIIVSFMFHRFFNSLARSRYLSLFSDTFSFILWSTWTAKSTTLQIFFFYYYYYYKVWSSVRDLVIRLYIKVPQELVRVISRSGAGLCIYHLSAWSNLNFFYYHYYSLRVVVFFFFYIRVNR